MVVNIYLAGSMFCENDRMYNAYLAQKIRENCGNKINLYVPQENTSINDKTKCANSYDIFYADYERLQNTNILIARIDGDVIPSGTSTEIGLMAERIMNMKQNNKKISHYIIGLCTDSRNPKSTFLKDKNDIMKNNDIESQYCYYNLFTVGAIKKCGKLVTNVDELILTIQNIVNQIED